MSQDCGFSLEDQLRKTHCIGGHPALVQGHGIVLEYYVVLCLVGSASRACPLCHSVSQDCGFSLEDPQHETHCIGGHLTLVKPYIQYFERLEASQNNIVHFDMKKSISIDGILVEYVGSSCSENVISIKMRVPLIHYSEM